LKSSNRFIAGADWVHIGTVIGAHGIRGAVRIYSYAETSELFAPHSSLSLVDASGARRKFTVVSAQAQKNVVRLAFQEVATRDQAEALKGCQVCIPRAVLPPLESGTYYWADLIGMAVYTEADDYLGQIQEIIPTGANDVYVVKRPEVPEADEILLPAIATVIVAVDVAGRRMQVRVPEGLV
jgi:16S rRNA processing protein RimM